MTWMADLQPCTYLHYRFDSPKLLAVGWLEYDYPYPIGDPPPGLLELLETRREQMRRFVAIGVKLGHHVCTICHRHQRIPDRHRPAGPLFDPTDSGVRPLSYEPEVMSSLHIWFPMPEAVYVVPELIIHNISKHRYLPPPEFINAVFNGPEPASPEYLDLFEHHLPPHQHQLIEWMRSKALEMQAA